MSSIFTLLVLLLGTATETTAQSARRAALSDVIQEMPRVSWQETSETADFDCDGKTDHAFLGRRDGNVIVAFRLTRSRKVQSFEFGIGASDQESICEEPAEIHVEDLDCDPSDAMDGVEGFRLSKSCKGLQLVGGECDSFHFYWNHVAKRMDWWRL